MISYTLYLFFRNASLAVTVSALWTLCLCVTLTATSTARVAMENSTEPKDMDSVAGKASFNAVTCKSY